MGDNEPAIILRKGEYIKPAIWFTVENVQQAYKELKGKGIHFLSEPFKIPTGFNIEFDDPFGNKLGITDYRKMPQSGG